LGGTSHVHLEIGPHRLLAVVIGDVLPEKGDYIGLRVSAEQVRLFDAEGRAVDRSMAIHLHPTSYDELNAILEALVTSVQAVLGGSFVGAYLQGSFAVGDYDEHSDVDF